MAISDRLTKLSEDITSTYNSIEDLGGTIPTHKNTENIAPAIESIYSRLPKITGTGSNITLTPTLKGRLGSVLNGDTKQSILPSGYTQVDYIESSGTQYIDTGYVINDKCSAKYKYEYISGAALSGVYNGLGSSDLYFGIVRSSTGKLAYRYAGDFYEGNVVDTNTLYDVEVSLIKNNQYLKVNGNTEVQSTNNISITNTNNCYIFDVNGLSITKISAKIYYFKIYDNNVLVRDFIPCYRNSDNEVGLYDLVNNVFYTNQGTGSFTYGSIAPTPDSPIDIQCVEGIQNISVYGKNLFNKNDVVNGALDGDGTLISNNYYCTSNYISVIPNTTYYKTATGSARFKYYDINKNRLSNVYNDIPNAGNAQAFTTPQNAYYIRLSIDQTNGTSVYVDTLQIEKGSTATTYQPYQTQTQEVNLGDIKLYNGDYITGTPDNWSIYRENGSVVLNENSTNIDNYINTNLTNVYGFSASITGMNNITSAGTSYCNILNKIVWNYNYDNESYYLSNNTFVFKISKTIIDVQTGNTTKDKLKSYLATNNLHLVGKLATPTTTPITDTTLISQLNNVYKLKSYDDTTNISVSGNLPMILEVSALKG